VKLRHRQRAHGFGRRGAQAWERESADDLLGYSRRASACSASDPDGGAARAGAGAFSGSLAILAVRSGHGRSVTAKDLSFPFATGFGANCRRPALSSVSTAPIGPARWWRGRAATRSRARRWPGLARWRDRCHDVLFLAQWECYLTVMQITSQDSSSGRIVPGSLASASRWRADAADGAAENARGRRGQRTPH
jgi:hypothetical protein